LFRASSGKFQYFLRFQARVLGFSCRSQLDSACGVGVKSFATKRNHLRVQLLDAIDHISERGDITMNKDNFEGTVRSAVGQGEKILGQATNDRSTTAQGYYDDAAGKARSAVGSAKDAVSGGGDAISSLDFSGLRDEISKLTQKVSDLTQNQVAAGRDQVVGAMGAAGESLSQSAANAQDKFTALEGDVESRIKKNPWGAVAVAGLIGLLIGKMS
jgi:ElaB/YqjD/DUF883 family membrane-anchored ribosome-binding protein/uncharacterized protein YjbJ (UPF0337 family)